MGGKKKKGGKKKGKGKKKAAGGEVQVTHTHYQTAFSTGRSFIVVRVQLVTHCPLPFIRSRQGQRHLPCQRMTHAGLL